MLKLISLLLLMLTASKPNDNLLDWSSERRLTWSDFKGQPDGTSVNAALTSTSINIDYSYNNREFKYKIRCRFDPSKSWGRVKSDYILLHEQSHFDIAEIHARVLNKELKNYKFSQNTANEDIGRIYNKVMRQHNALQAEYDEQSNYSRNENNQYLWQKKIADTLTTLLPHANYR